MPEPSVNNEEVSLTKDSKSLSSVELEGNAGDNQETSNLALSTAEVQYDLREFCLHSILNNNIRNKSITLLGSFPRLSKSDKAIVIFEKQAFQESEISTTLNAYNETNGKEANGNHKQLETTTETNDERLTKPSYFCSDLQVQTEFINNIYGSYQCTPPSKLSGIKATVIYPATDKHIEKYSICDKFVINETPELYKDITLPYLTSSHFSLEWVYNILEHKQETERIIFEDADPENGFILLPDLKWDGRNVENLYVLAIPHKHNIKSLRDIDASHLPLLRNIRTKVAEALESRYGILPCQLRIYFHYQPSFYHLHIHVNAIRNEAPGIWCEKSHMLDTVINNLELLPDYYKKATLPFVLYSGNKLLELYEAKMAIKTATKRSADDDVDKDNDNDVKVKKQKVGKTMEAAANL